MNGTSCDATYFFQLVKNHTIDCSFCHIICSLFIEVNNMTLDRQKVDKTEFLVIDFETLTPKGYPPEPIELGVQMVNGLEIDYSVSIDWLIQPPAGFHVTALDISLKNIYDSDLQGKPTIEEVLKKLDSLCSKGDFIFIAHNANYEASILSRYVTKFPNIENVRIIDTIKLAKYVLPNLANYKLDTLASKLDLAIPINRHRSLPDCILTAQVFIELLTYEASRHKIEYLDDLLNVAGIYPSYSHPKQLSFFDNI